MCPTRMRHCSCLRVSFPLPCAERAQFCSVAQSHAQARTSDGPAACGLGARSDSFSPEGRISQDALMKCCTATWTEPSVSLAPMRDIADATATAGNLRQREKRDESGFLRLPTRVPVRPSTTSLTSGCSSASEFKHPLPPSARQSRRHAAASVRYLPRGGGQHIGAAGSFPPQPPRGESCMLSVRQRHLEQDRHSPRDDPAAKAAELAQRLAASNEWVKRQAFNSTGEL